MKLLVLGGTKFLGRHVVGAALARGDEVTIFNRGLHNPELYPEVEKLRGDRDGGLEVLRGRRWDAVVDTSGYVPRVVRASAELLSDSIDLYVFVSSMSVYADFRQPNDEGSPTGRLDDETVEEVTGETYGPLKALCERAAEAALQGRVLNVRAGLIVGPYDPTGRFSYWVERVARGGEVLAPAPRERQVQFVDARDLSEWVLRMIDARRAGVFNAAGPDYLLTMEGLLEACREACETDARFTWVGEQFLIDKGVEPWGNLPLWLPESAEQHRYFLAENCERAFAAGLAFRPVADTARDTLAWLRAGSPGMAADAPNSVQAHTLKPERERELLDAWRDAQ
ncbi:MAG TPA: NAD-dependent epimerase/dehydratase family protein [Pyrinomonadaceae bacterium]|jgi:2'-hydroxyisoflavone reductase|nr:NAD-dependent epimerase/dehydratase family protein [Pyrinomonadaceae bacterium]